MGQIDSQKHQVIEYELAMPQRIVFGWGRRREIGSLAATLGRRAFIVGGSRTLERNGALAEICESLKAARVEPEHIATISREPELGDVDALTDKLEKYRAGDDDLLVAIGGGSAIDLAKAAAALATNRESSSVVDYLEGVGRGLKLKIQPLPMLAMPTTAGTGAEATKNAVITSYDPPFKKSLRSDMMLPRIVLVDPELCVSNPPSVTANSGLDAITQLIESFISRRAKPISQALAIQGLQLGLPALSEAFRNGNCRWAREAMSHAALLSGIALANSGLGMAHGVAAALGAECKVGHGLACAAMLPVALRFNRSICEQQLATLGRAIHPDSNLDDEQAADTLIRDIEQLETQLGIPRRLRDLGVRQDQIPALATGSHGNSLSGNPRDVSDADLRELLESNF
jgi:alcohol dehydrogenase class IV